MIAKRWLYISLILAVAITAAVSILEPSSLTPEPAITPAQIAVPAREETLQPKQEISPTPQPTSPPPRADAPFTPQPTLPPEPLLTPQPTAPKDIQQKYSHIAQLEPWHECISPIALALPGVTLTDADEVRNRVVIGVLNETLIDTVEKELESNYYTQAIYMCHKNRNLMIKG